MIEKMYNEKVIEYFQNPKNVGEIENPEGVGEVGSPVCGDMMKIFISVKDNRITDIKFKTFGCASANRNFVYDDGAGIGKDLG